MEVEAVRLQLKAASTEQRKKQIIFRVPGGDNYVNSQSSNFDRIMRSMHVLG